MLIDGSYTELVKQTFKFPQEGINVKGEYLSYYNLDLPRLIHKYGTPLKISYLPKIESQIQKAKNIFAKIFAKRNYDANYYYTYCTKSSQFAFVLDEVLKQEVHLETSSAFDFDIMQTLYQNSKLDKKKYIICNGFKQKPYLRKITKFINEGFENTIPILDNKEELGYYKKHTKKSFQIGIRVAAEEEPSSPFYTGRLGIRSKDILEFYVDEIEGYEDILQLKMLHFFLQGGIKDDIYYWSELNKIINLYCQLKKICPELDSINIGGGFPIRHSLGFDYDYQFMVDQIVRKIKQACTKARIPVPHIYTEFGQYTVGESMMHIYQVIAQKVQNEREVWYMIDSSFITTLPDAWSIGERFLVLPINKWDREYQRVILGGISCDSHDYYDSDEHTNEVFLPKLDMNAIGKNPLYVGFFHTGAYQDQISGYGGIKHCLIPSPKHVLLRKDSNGRIVEELYAKEQPAKSMLKILRYT